MYDALREAAYSGRLQSALRASGRPWAVVLTYAAPADPAAALPPPDDACGNRFGAACLDGAGISAPAAKGLLAAGVVLVVVAAAVAHVACDRRQGSRRVRRGVESVG